jgi:3-oxoacyl-[acyl-carrier protein] reductase
LELGLKGKVALVPASSKGIGLGVAKVLATEGCKVVVSSRNQDSISKARDAIVKETGNKDVYSVKADLAVKADLDNLIDQATAKFGTIDILAYNTGPPKPSTFADLSDADWEHGVKLLLLSAVWLTKRVVPGMVQKKWGRLIYITSSTLRQPVPNLVLSNTVRLGLAGLSKSLALEYGSKGITSNGIMQGHILTDRQRQVAQDVSSRTGRGYETDAPGRSSRKVRPYRGSRVSRCLPIKRESELHQRDNARDRRRTDQISLLVVHYRGSQND